MFLLLLQPVFLSEGSQLLQQARQEMEALSEFVTSAQVRAAVGSVALCFEWASMQIPCVALC
jgi:hypothetical protein